MKVQTASPMRGPHTRWLYVLCVSLLFVTAVTWLNAIFDHPIDDAVVTGMMSPECVKVSRMPAGSVLSAAQPDDEICRSFFLYRATTQNAAGDVASYQNMIMRERVGEFWRMIGYALVLWLLVTAACLGFARLLKRIVASRMHRSER
ncbi:hypothetical protein [Paraburkholderia sp. ZP32-5]|uniref:hypothetical protein n=1 Tax=Paraburkholderia sp. ZP32-5 TaxID=2883245 RepID=UPI001F2A32FF|nr:hypothetical protein [Paraburkholderia sp. ZP32-5]